VKPLPSPVWLHCVIQLNATFLFSVGGYHEDYVADSYLYNLETESWSRGNFFNRDPLGGFKRVS
jgi:hypothetical protein